MNKLKVAVTSLLLVVSAVLVVYLLANREDKQRHTVVNEVALSDASVDKARQTPHDFSLNNLSNAAPVAVHFAEKPTVLLFFTSWCPYCNEDAPKIVELEKKYKGEINVYGINVTARDNLDDVRDYVQRHNIEYPVLLDESADIYNKFGGVGFPSLYFFNERGEVADAIVGSADMEQIEDSFKQLIS